MLRRVAWMLVILLGGCGQFEPAHDQRINPPASYEAWWSSTEACSGRTGSFSSVQWFMVPGHSFDCPNGKCVGRWEGKHKIYIAEDWLHSEMVVRHEMLHDLIGRPGHPDPPFGHGCPLTWETWTAAASAPVGGVGMAMRID
jgi:hypothetical protein